MHRKILNIFCYSKKCKLKLYWDITTHLLGYLNLKRLTVLIMKRNWNLLTLLTGMWNHTTSLENSLAVFSFNLNIYLLYKPTLPPHSRKMKVYVHTKIWIFICKYPCQLYLQESKSVFINKNLLFMLNLFNCRHCKRNIMYSDCIYLSCVLD